MHQTAPLVTTVTTRGTTAAETAGATTVSSGAELRQCAGAGSPDLVFPDEASDGMVVMETMPVGDVVEVGHADYLSTMVELADFSSVKVRARGGVELWLDEDRGDWAGGWRGDSSG